MNVNLLTIDSYLAAATDVSPFPLKPDSNTKAAQFALTLEGEKLHVKTHEKPITYYPQEFTQSIDEKIKPENTRKDDNNTNLIEQNEIPGYLKDQSKQPNEIQSWLGENFTVVEQNKEGAPTKNEAKSSSQFAQIITNTQNKSASVTGHAVKSTEIKLLHSTEKGQLGIKTVLPIKSNGQNGLKAITPELSKITPAAKKQPETASNNEKAAVSAKTISLTEKGNTKELAPEISDNTGKSTNAPGIKPSAMNIDPATAHDQTSETKPNSKQIDLVKLKMTAKTDAKAGPSQNTRNLSNPNSKEDVSAGNNFSENQSGQKLNIAAAQVTTGQTKDRNNLTSNKTPSQSFEQVLSQNNSQTLITETPASAKNATANTMGRSSSSDVSADIGRQILESVQRSISQQDANRQITVRLNPPELGKVVIRFQQQNAEITGLMEVNKAQTRFEIEQALPQIIRDLADCGIQIKRLEVMLSNEQQPGQGALGNQSLQSGTTQQQYSGNPGTPGNDTDVYDSNEWLTSNNGYENLSELQGALITDGSINLLI